LSFSKTDAIMCLGADFSPQADPQISTLFLPVRGPKDGANLRCQWGRVGAAHTNR